MLQAPQPITQLLLLTTMTTTLQAAPCSRMNTSHPSLIPNTKPETLTDVLLAGILSMTSVLSICPSEIKFPRNDLFVACTQSHFDLAGEL